MISLRASKRQAKILHLKNENTIGASIVQSFMNKSCSFHLAKDSSTVPALDKAGLLLLILDSALAFVWNESSSNRGQFLDDAIATNAGVVVFLDCTKLGRVSSKELDAHMDMVQKVLLRRPQASVAFVMAPIYTSERVGNAIRSEAADQKCLIHF